MVSTFHGLEVAKRGMTTQQAALYTTGHNISNANTPGYTRQRVNFEQTSPYPSPGLNRPQIPGQMGTGVAAGSIQRVRDSFIDDQYRGENNKLGYWGARSQALSSMETIMNEPSDLGIANTLDRLWESLQDLSLTPQDSGARSVVRQRGLAVVDTFNYTYDSLKAVQQDYRNEIDVTQKAVNSILKQINDINKQIGDVEVHGYLPNDLYDQRDLLIDDLSSYINIKIEPKSSGGLSSSIAEGKFDIYLADNNGNKLSNVQLIKSTTNEAFGVQIQYADPTDASSPVEKINFRKLHADGGGYDGFAENPLDPTNVPSYSFNTFEEFSSKTTGSLKAIVEAYGYQGATGKVKGMYPDMLKKLDEMVYTFVEKFNEVHSSGWSLSEIEQGQKNGKKFFDYNLSVANPISTDPTGAAKALKLAQAIIDSTDNIAAAAEGTTVYKEFTPAIENDPSTVGNPDISGRFEFPTGETSLDIEISWNETDTDWNYKVTSNPSNTAIGTGPLTVTNGIAELPGFPGVKIDFSDVTAKANGDVWTTTIENNGGIKPSDEAFAGSGSNAAALANVKDEILKYGGTTSSVTSFYQSVIGDMGVQASQAKQMLKNTNTLLESALIRRDSVSAVSLDEEMTNMIKFQHAYNAAARNITMVDEMLDKIINSMGLVGR